MTSPGLTELDVRGLGRSLAWDDPKPPELSHHARKLAKGVIRFLGHTALAGLVPLTIYALWSYVTTKEIVPPTTLPAPHAVFETLHEMLSSGELFDNLSVSLLRVARGFALGSALGLGLGILLGFSQAADNWVGPTFRTFAQVPALAWIPLLMQFFGIDETLKLVIMAKACLIPVTLMTAAGIREIPDSYRELGRVLRLPSHTVVSRIILPGALPAIFSGLRQGLAYVWISLVIVEMLASADGIGYLMHYGRMIFQLDIVMVSILMIGLVGFLVDAALSFIETRLLRWHVKEA